MEEIKIDEYKCEYFQSHREENNWDIPIDHDWCTEWDCKCEDVPLEECVVKVIEYCKLKDKQLEEKEEELKLVKSQYNCYACDTCHGREDYRNLKRHYGNLLPTYYKTLKAVKRYKNNLEEIHKLIHDTQNEELK